MFIQRIRALYHTSKLVWVISRVGLLLFLVDAMINQGMQPDLGVITVVNTVFLLYILALAYMLLVDLIKKVPTIRILKIFTGGLTIFLGLILSFMMVAVGYDLLGFQSYFLYVIPMWLILLGFYDLVGLNPTEV